MYWRFFRSAFFRRMLYTIQYHHHISHAQTTGNIYFININISLYRGTVRYPYGVYISKYFNFFVITSTLRFADPNPYIIYSASATIRQTSVYSAIQSSNLNLASALIYEYIIDLLADQQIVLYMLDCQTARLLDYEVDYIRLVQTSLD